jgi:hypothetical protein
MHEACIGLLSRPPECQGAARDVDTPISMKHACQHCSSNLPAGAFRFEGLKADPCAAKLMGHILQGDLKFTERLTQV